MATVKQLYTCIGCGASFRRYASLLKNPDRPFCSRMCVGAAKRHGSTLHCAMCDGEFYRRFGEQDVGVTRRQFCSKACYRDWRDSNRKPGTYAKIGSRHVHRIVAEECLGRPLTSDEVVHHINEDKQDNRPANLAVLPDQSFHSRVHAGKVSDAELRRFSLA